MGGLVHRVKANYLVVGGCVLSLVAPLVMVPTTPQTVYWKSGESQRVLRLVDTRDTKAHQHFLPTSSVPQERMLCSLQAIWSLLRHFQKRRRHLQAESSIPSRRLESLLASPLWPS